MGLYVVFLCWSAVRRHVTPPMLLLYFQLVLLFNRITHWITCNYFACSEPPEGKCIKDTNAGPKGDWLSIIVSMNFYKNDNMQNIWPSDVKEIDMFVVFPELYYCSNCYGYSNIFNWDWFKMLSGNTTQPFSIHKKLAFYTHTSEHTRIGRNVTVDRGAVQEGWARGRRWSSVRLRILPFCLCNWSYVLCDATD